MFKMRAMYAKHVKWVRADENLIRDLIRNKFQAKADIEVEKQVVDVMSGLKLDPEARYQLATGKEIKWEKEEK